MTSWNEWHEGTQIEPAVPKARGPPERWACVCVFLRERGGRRR